jgi:hypothetical protein
MAKRDFGGEVKGETLPERAEAADEKFTSILLDFAMARRQRLKKEAEASRTFAQGRLLTVLTQAASDMRHLARTKTTSSATRRQRAMDAMSQLPIQNIKIALVNRRRDDVCDSRMNDVSKHTRNYAFHWRKTALSHTIEENPFSDDHAEYDEGKWTADILNLLSESVALGANVVCLGEFDYPLFVGERGAADRKTFEKRLVQKIDGADQPIFAVLGTHHRLQRLPQNAEDWTGPLAQNVAMIALSSQLRDPGAPGIREVFKRTPASKAGELLTGLHGIDMEVFDTILGKYAVIICSDAYDPAIVLECFANSFDGDHKRDVILVPSYNKSAKLTHMCQALSLLSRCIVVMVDACSVETAASGPFEKSSVWVCGLPVDEKTVGALAEKHRVCRWSDERELVAGGIKVLDVSLPALDNFISHMETVDPIPLFAGVRKRTWRSRP